MRNRRSRSGCLPIRERCPLNRVLFVALAYVVALAVSTTSASATPSFARRYETSCQTCHIAFPKLNPFGEAFRQLGYQLPDETEDQIKQPDVPLGAEAYKRVWPNSVWPGAIPSQLPVAVVAEFLWVNQQQLEEDAGEVTKEKVTNDFQFPKEIAAVIAGSAGERIAYFGEIVFERTVEDGEAGTEVGIEHLDLRLIRPIRDSNAFNLKIGAFQPELVTTFDHARRLTLDNYASMFSVHTASPGGAEAVGAGHHGGGGGIALPAVATGFEGFGTVQHRIQWSAGVVNGMGPGEETVDGNSKKDYMGRLSYKLGGMAPDGSNASTFTTNPKNWQEKSLRVGVFGYWGDGSDILLEVMDEGVMSELEITDSDRYGVDVNAFYGDFNFTGALVQGTDKITVTGDPDESGTFDYTAFFAQTDVVAHYPWLHFALRYQSVDLPREGVETWERGTASATALIRANVKAVVEYSQDLNEGDNHSFLVGSTIGF